MSEEILDMLSQIKSLADRTTPGECAYDWDRQDNVWIYVSSGGQIARMCHYENARADAEFFARSKYHLLNLVEALEDAVKNFSFIAMTAKDEVVLHTATQTLARIRELL